MSTHFIRHIAFATAFVSLGAAGCGKGKAELALGTVGETMAYDQTSLTVKSGQTVHLVLANHATSAVMRHNWVLVQPGHEADVATAGMTVGESGGYIPQGDANVIANTPLSTPGGTVDVTFTAPAPGAYPYICTFPGHYLVMKGTLTVTP